ncbi:hypothetical protein [Nocardia gipuzkoensis]|uniref:hypothetical protein n=1 Tax=Nocardia gipuzkoensis TaxID=2749991 RepID=UPI00237D729D|nr:hypothetical protein [Nocardia gipuzkoensis]MDE1672682.1 hypothetical protein [Nocardia gipuzkoensis]
MSSEHLTQAEPAADAIGPHHTPVIQSRMEGRIVVHWPLRRNDANGYHPRVELAVTRGHFGDFTATVIALYTNAAHHRVEATGAPHIEFRTSCDAEPPAVALERAYDAALSTLRARFDDKDVDVHAIFDHRSRIYTDPRMFVPFETPDIPAHDYPVRRWEMHRDTDVTGNSGTGLVAHGVTFPDGRVAFRWRGNPATTTTADSIRDVISIHGHNGTTRVVYVDIEPAWSDSTRVAVRVGAHDEVETWAVLRCPIIDLGSYDAEATSIGSQLNGSFHGDVIVVDSVDGFPAGCSTWAQFSSKPDREFPAGDERAQAELEHWNCEHALFGTAPLDEDRWVRTHGPHEERWSFTSLDYTATIAPNRWGVLELSVWYVEKGERVHIIKDAVQFSVENAKAAAIEAIFTQINIRTQPRLNTRSPR